MKFGDCVEEVEKFFRGRRAKTEAAAAVARTSAAIGGSCLASVPARAAALSDLYQQTSGGEKRPRIPIGKAL